MPAAAQSTLRGLVEPLTGLAEGHGPTHRTRGSPHPRVAPASLPGLRVTWHSARGVPPSLLVTAHDAELPALLRGSFPGVVFATADQVRAMIRVKPGSLVVLLDAADASLVSGLIRKDVRAVAIVTRQKVPMMFGYPIIASVERPVVSARLLMAINLAMAELGPPGAQAKR
jgi:hypothetical protein